MQDEPRRHVTFLVLAAITSIGAVPIWFVGRPTVFVLGVPLWLWSSMVFTAGLSAVTVWGILKLWKDEDLD